MTSFVVLFTFLLTLATFQRAMSSCSYDNCVTPTGTGSTYCGLARTYVDCLQENVVENDDCNFVVQGTVGTLLEEVEDVMSDLGYSDDDEEDSCSYSSCIVPSGPASSYCGQARDYVACLERNVVDNDQCDSITKNAVIDSVEKMNVVMDEAGCDGASTVLSSIGMSLGLSLLVYLYNSSP